MNCVTRLHGDRALTHVAILRLPAIGMVNDDTVAAFDLVHRSAVLLIAYEMVRHIVSHTPHLARRTGDDRSIVRGVLYPEVGAIVAIVCGEAAIVVADTLARIVIEILLNPTILAKGAGEG